jgi:hypothetical protein
MNWLRFTACASTFVFGVDLVAQSSICMWGLNRYDSRVLEKRCLKVFAGGNDTCVLSADGTITIWGLDGPEQFARVPSPPSGACVC